MTLQKESNIAKLIILLILIFSLTYASTISGSIYFTKIQAQKQPLQRQQQQSLFRPTLLSLNPLSKASPPPASSNGKTPAIVDSSLKADLVFRGLHYPSNMAFLAPNDILVLEKTTGKVIRIVNGTVTKDPLLDVNVAVNDERGMLGIAISQTHEHKPTYVFLYYTEASTKDGDDRTEGKSPLGNRLYRYELVNNKLVNAKLLLDLPATPGTHHNGGNIRIGPDQNLYVVIGDVEGHLTQSQNIKNGPPPDRTSGILRITQDGKPVGNGILSDTFPLNLYYAYGIRNSFGMDFDPVTAKLWNTENGPGFGDEINLVEPGFNSGWRKVQGMWEVESYFGGSVASTPPNNLIDFNGKGKYSTPEFTWNQTVAPTALKFLTSNKLGKQYENDIFVSDINNGNIYHFQLNKTRTGFILNGLLTDKVANTISERNTAVFATGFAGISDLEVGPDGYLYLLTFHKSGGSIYRIIPVSLQDRNS
jgi:aldose sugar dehydrogenase